MKIIKKLKLTFVKTLMNATHLSQYYDSKKDKYYIKDGFDK